MSTQDTKKDESVIEPETKVVDPTKEPEDKVIVADDPQNPAKKEDEQEVVPPKRPVAYIPLKKYHEETGELKAKIAELEALVHKEPEEKTGIVVNDSAIQAYADKHGMEPEAVKDLIALLPKPKDNVSMSEDEVKEFSQIIASEKARVAQEYEMKDWQDNAVPTIKEFFPKATDEQLKEAQKLLDPIAHTEEGVNQGYDFIVFKNKDKLADIFKEEGDKPAPANKSTLERGKQGTGMPSRLTVKDFAGDNPDFSILENLSAEDANALAVSFEGPTYRKYLAYVAKNQPLEVVRGGAKIKLK